MARKKADKILFREVQYLSGTLLVYIGAVSVLAVDIPIAYGAFQQLVLGKPWGDEPMSDGAMVGMLLFMLLLTVGVFLFTFRSRLELYVDREGVHYKYPGFIGKQHLIPRKSIRQYEIKKYRPFLDYGGVGRRRALGTRRRMAFIIKGKMGIRLFLSDGYEILFGTQRPEALARAMKKIMEEEMLPDERE